jgi:hypothetical protein
MFSKTKRLNIVSISIMFVVVFILGCASLKQRFSRYSSDLENLFNNQNNFDSRVLRQYSNGDKDATQILQEYINRGDVNVYLPPGMYRLEGTLELRSNLKIVGAGIDKTTILLSSRRCGLRGVDCKNIVISDLKIVGKQIAETRKSYAIKFITSFKGKNSNIIVKNMEVYDIGGSFFSATGNNVDLSLINIGVFYDNDKKYTRPKNPVAQGYYITAFDFEWNTIEVAKLSESDVKEFNVRKGGSPTPNNILIKDVFVYGGDNGLWIGGSRDLKIENATFIEQKNQAILFSVGDWSNSGVTNVVGDNIYIKGGQETVYGLKLAGYSVMAKKVLWGVRDSYFKNVIIENCERPVLL